MEPDSVECVKLFGTCRGQDQCIRDPTNRVTGVICPYCDVMLRQVNYTEVLRAHIFFFHFKVGCRHVKIFPRIDASTSADLCYNILPELTGTNCYDRQLLRLCFYHTKRYRTIFPIGNTRCKHFLKLEGKDFEKCFFLCVMCKENFRNKEDLKKHVFDLHFKLNYIRIRLSHSFCNDFNV